MNKLTFNSSQLNELQETCRKWAETNPPILQQLQQSWVDKFKNGNKIHIKKENKGKFTSYCGGKVTSECIQRGKNSPNPAIRKRATFAANARKWSH